MGRFKAEREGVPGSTLIGTHSRRTHGRRHKKGDRHHGYGHPGVQRREGQHDGLSATFTVRSRARSRDFGRWDSNISAGRRGGRALFRGPLAHSTGQACEVPRCRGQIRFPAPFAHKRHASEGRPPTPSSPDSRESGREPDTRKDPNLTTFPSAGRKFPTLEKASRPQRDRIQRAFTIWGERRKLHYNFGAGFPTG